MKAAVVLGPLGRHQGGGDQPGAEQSERPPAQLLDGPVRPGRPVAAPAGDVLGAGHGDAGCRTARWRARSTPTSQLPRSVVVTCSVGARTSAPSAELQAAMCTARSRSSDTSPFQKVGLASGRASSFDRRTRWGLAGCAQVLAAEPPQDDRRWRQGPAPRPRAGHRFEPGDPAERGEVPLAAIDRRALPGAEVEGHHRDADEEGEGEAERDQPHRGGGQPRRTADPALGEWRQHPVREVDEDEREEEQPQRARRRTGREPAPGVRLDAPGVAVGRRAAGVPAAEEAGASVAREPVEQDLGVIEHRRGGGPADPVHAQLGESVEGVVDAGGVHPVLGQGSLLRRPPTRS